MNLYISDMHIGHANVTDEGTNFDNRPFSSLDEMHRAFVENWNNEVTNGDDVYIGGDMVWKVTDETIAIVSQLKGKKHLILGNHDNVQDARYKQLFVEICDYKEVVDKIDNEQFRVIISHEPQMIWNRQHRKKLYGDVWKCPAIHVYGHLHNGEDEELYQELLSILNARTGRDAIAINIGCMFWNYTPVTLKEMVEGYKARQALTAGQYPFTVGELIEAIDDFRRNPINSGQQGTGKTALLCQAIEQLSNLKR